MSAPTNTTIRDESDGETAIAVDEKRDALAEQARERRKSPAGERDREHRNARRAQRLASDPAFAEEEKRRRREWKAERRKKRAEDPAFDAKCRQEDREAHERSKAERARKRAEDPAFDAKCREKEEARNAERRRRRREDPEFARKDQERSHAAYLVRRTDPEKWQAWNEYSRERYHERMKDPEYAAAAKEKARAKHAREKERPGYKAKSRARWNAIREALSLRARVAELATTKAELQDAKAEAADAVETRAKLAEALQLRDEQRQNGASEEDQTQLSLQIEQYKLELDAKYEASLAQLRAEMRGAPPAAKTTSDSERSRAPKEPAPGTGKRVVLDYLRARPGVRVGKDELNAELVRAKLEPNAVTFVGRLIDVDGYPILRPTPAEKGYAYTS